MRQMQEKVCVGADDGVPEEHHVVHMALAGEMQRTRDEKGIILGRLGRMIGSEARCIGENNDAANRGNGDPFRRHGKAPAAA